MNKRFLIAKMNKRKKIIIFNSNIKRKKRKNYLYIQEIEINKYLNLMKDHLIIQDIMLSYLMIIKQKRKKIFY